jgi:chromate reductase
MLPFGRYDPFVRILAVCGSLQAKSSNSTLLRVLAAVAPSGVNIVSFDGLGALPHFNPDLEMDAPLAVVEAWRTALRESDAVFIATPEYGHSLPGSLKNAVDWVIGTGELERKIVAITSAVPGADRGRAGLSALRQTLGAVSAKVIGGEPILRGPNLERDVEALLAELMQAITRAKVSGELSEE